MNLLYTIRQRVENFYCYQCYLLLSGGRVIMACRNMTACEKARSEIVENTFNKNVHCRHLDLACLKSVREFAAEVKKGRECNDKCQRN